MPSPGLAERLRSGTRDLHTQTERAGVMPALLRGELPRERYCALLRNLHALYVALESALTQHAAHGEVAPVVFPALFRQHALADDLTVLHGSDWAQSIGLQSAAQHYVERLHGLAAGQPGLLTAHAYVRYLGDLSGGQALRRIVARTYALADDAGARFYDFGPAEAVRMHAQRFRDGLGALGIDVPHMEALVAEARWAFARHGELFEQLAEAR
jgi:heme oxygenase